MLRIERHIHDQDPIDLTRWATALDITLSTSEPFALIGATLRPTFNERGVMPDPGDWLVVRNEATGVAVTQGMVDKAPAPGLIREGAALTTGNMRIQAHSWLGVLGAAQVYARSSAGRSSGAGTMFSFEEWKEIIEVLTTIPDTSLFIGQHGKSLAALIRKLGKVRLPESLGGGFLGESVAVAHDKETCEALGLKPSIDTVQGPSIIGDRLWPSQTTALSYITSLFRPAPDLIELFELNAEPLRGNAPSILPDGQLARALKATPSLVYRLKPWRMESVVAYLNRLAPKSRSESIVDTFNALSKLAASAFPEPFTWSTVSASIPASDVISFSPPMRDGNARINAVTCDPCMGGDVQDLKLSEEFGLPIADKKDIERVGLRLFELTWPFFSPAAKAETLADPAAWMRVMASVAAQMLLHRERFFAGEFRVPLRLDLKPGETFQVELKDGRYFSGYIESVRHTVTRDLDRALEATTTITYSRGLFDAPGRDPIANPDRQAIAGEVQPAEEKPTSATSPTGTGPCAAGAPWGRSWGLTFGSIDETKFPTGLLQWAINRGFIFPRNVSLEVHKRLEITAGVGFVIERYWRQINPSARFLVISSYRTDTIEGSSHIDGAAVDFAVLFPPTGDRERDALSPRVPVLQNWAALQHLQLAGRIPSGGKGVYLNLSPTGIKLGRATDASNPNADPTNPKNAGRPSARAGRAADLERFPPGGSGGAHYDFRGAFGYAVTGVDGTRVSNATSWYWADTDGDGRDEYRLGAAGRGGGSEIYGVMHPAIKDYLSKNGWQADPFMPAVGPSVPNLMQVLGQVESCFVKEVGP
jgi:hypothetical protein